MKYLLLILLLTCCSVLRKNKTVSRTDSSGNTKITSGRTVTDRIDTLIVIPASVDSALAYLKELQTGIQVGQTTVRYDTISRTVYLTNPIKEIPVYLYRTIHDTLVVRQQVRTSSDQKNVTVKRVSYWWWILAAVGIAVFIFLKYILRKA